MNNLTLEKFFSLHISRSPCNTLIFPLWNLSLAPWLFLLFPPPLTFWNSSRLCPRCWSLPCGHSPRPSCQSMRLQTLSVHAEDSHICTFPLSPTPIKPASTSAPTFGHQTEPSPCSSVSLMVFPLSACACITLPGRPTPAWLLPHHHCHF